MTDKEHCDERGTYEIRVKGMLDEKWSGWFNGLTIAFERASDGSPITTLTGVVADQAKLRGILGKIWDLNLKLISATQIESQESGTTCESDPQQGGK